MTGESTPLSPLQALTQRDEILRERINLLQGGLTKAVKVVAELSQAQRETQAHLQALTGVLAAALEALAATPALPKTAVLGKARCLLNPPPHKPTAAQHQWLEYLQHLTAEEALTAEQRRALLRLAPAPAAQ